MICRIHHRRVRAAGDWTGPPVQSPWAVNYLNRVVAAFAFLFLAAGISGCHSEVDDQLSRITIGSNPPGTNYNLLGGGIAKLLEERLGVASTVRPFGGSSVYVPMLHRGEITLGINSSMDSYLSYRGIGPYESPMSNLRALMSLWTVGLMYVVRADSGVHRIEELLGKRVVIIMRANTSLASLHRAILATGGLTEESVVPITVSGLPEGLRLLTEGRVDAVSAAIDLALARQAHAAIPGGIRFLEMGQDEQKLSELMPGSWVATAIPGPVTVALDKPTRIANFNSFINTGVHLPENDAYIIVKTIHGNWESLQNDYPILAAIPADSLAPANTPHPYHPGAIRYFKEVGLWNEVHEDNQAKLMAVHRQ